MIKAGKGRRGEEEGKRRGKEGKGGGKKINVEGL